MAEIKPSMMWPDVLLLNGRTQIKAALTLLQGAGVNQLGQAKLQETLTTHDNATVPEEVEEISFVMGGSLANSMKADIGMCAATVAHDIMLSADEQIAARGLLVTLGLVEGPHS